MTLASTVFKKSNFSKISHLNALGSQFDLDVKLVKVNLGSSFKQTWKAPLPQCYIPTPKVISLLVLEKKILKGFYHTGRGSHLGHVTKVFCINYS